ncbi:hypothetical protein [Halioxenophilus sp. WMMB6]|uniref:hypothetical protein n=1 Tax=Halioxenophilus sp. WMMB6 TaxID=3073815 RepID=UPI00295E88B4|nr:hypothetical protein [Halioxenophilus sp. WMMB6]
MIRIMTTTLAALTLTASTAFAGECTAPELPTIPDGASANMEAMVAGKKAVSEFQAGNTNYLNCLNVEIEAAKAAFASEKDETKKVAAQSNYQALLDTYNKAVTAEESLAAEFNTAIRAYKAANQ